MAFAHWADLELSGPIWTKKRELLCAAPSACHLRTHHSNTPLCVLPLSLRSLCLLMLKMFIEQWFCKVYAILQVFAGFCITTPCKKETSPWF